MGNAKYIGWVGTLAVALGIGTTVATSPGAAMAEAPSDSSSEADSSSSGASPGGERPSKVAAKPTASVNVSGGVQTGVDTEVAIGDPRSGIVQPSGGTRTSSAEQEPAASTDEETSAPPETSEPTAEEPGDTEPATDVHSSASEQPPVSETPAPRPATGAVALTERSDDDSPSSAQPVAVPSPAADTHIAGPEARVRAIRSLAAVEQAAATVASARSTSATVSAGPTAAAEQPLPAAPVNPLGVVSDVASRVVSGLLAWVGFHPSMTATPAAPVQSVGLWALLGWVRREVQRTFFNQGPTIGYDPALNSQTADGVVTGDLNAVDPDGDPLSLSLVEAPTHGTVVINRDGTFTYTPTFEFARSGGTDEFTVLAADTGFHLHGPGGVFAPDFGHTTLVKASVDLFAIQTTIDVGDGPTDVAVSPDGATAYVTNSLADTVSVIDTATNTVTTTTTVGNAPRVAVSPDSATAYVAAFGEGTISVIDTATNAVITIDDGAGPAGVAVSPDGTRLYVSNSTDGTVYVIGLPW